MDWLRKVIKGEGPGATRIYDPNDYSDSDQARLLEAEARDARLAQWHGAGYGSDWQQHVLNKIEAKRQRQLVAQAAQKEDDRKELGYAIRNWAATGRPLSNTALEAAARLGTPLPAEISNVSSGGEGVSPVLPMSPAAIAMAAGFGADVSNLVNVYNANKPELDQGMMLDDSGNVVVANNYRNARNNLQADDLTVQQAFETNRMFDRGTGQMVTVSTADIMNAPGRFVEPINLPTDYIPQSYRTPSGMFVQGMMAVPGSETASELNTAMTEADEAVRQGRIKARTMTDAFLHAYNSANDNTTGRWGSYYRTIRDPEALAMEASVNTILSISSIGVLQDMKASGANPGQVTEGEWQRFDTARGNLALSQNAEDFKRNLRILMREYVSITQGEEAWGVFEQALGGNARTSTFDPEG